MNKATYLLLFFFTTSITLFSQSIDDSFPKEKMRRDFELLKEIRLQANSGLYKYRTKKQTDSIYAWAAKEIENSTTYRDFYNITCQLVDFEGSTHSSARLSNRFFKNLKKEKTGYFPYPLKLVEEKWIVNYKNEKIPLGSEIVSINNIQIEDIIQNINKYYTTDGINITGKSVGINQIFSRYYRCHYGIQNNFNVKYKRHDSDKEEVADLKSVSYSSSYENFKNRYSLPFDHDFYKNFKIDEMYSYKSIDKNTGLLTLNSFAIGGSADAKEHREYVSFLDSIFSKINKQKVKNLIVDVRNNGGGSDPNDLVTYSYLTERNFSENKQAWVSFQKIPHLKHYKHAVPPFLRFLAIGKYNKWYQKEFNVIDSSRFYQGNESNDHKIWKPNKNAFHGNVYLLISPRVASAGTLFAAMLAGNKNTKVIGEETMGGYYGHNGHTPFTYILPKSKIEIRFFVVNLEQDVLKKENQKYNRGIIPDYNVPQTYTDFLNQTDTQMNFTIDLINNSENINETISDIELK